MTSAKSAPHAERALAVDGARTRGQPSSRAIGTMLRPEAPPPATSVTVARVDSLHDRDLPDRSDDVLGRDRQRRVRRLVDTHSERCRDRFLDDGVGGVRVERQPAPEEVAGVDPAEHDRGIGDGGLRTAAAIADRARIRAGALWPDPEQSARVDPDDRAAARADRLDVDRPDAGDVTDPASAKPRLGCVRDLPARDQAHVERGAPGVADDQVGRSGFFLLHPGLRTDVGKGGNRSHRRSGADRVDRTLDDLLGAPGAAERRGDEDVAAQPGFAEVRLQRAQIALHQRLQRRVDCRGGSAAVLADDRVQTVRERERRSRPFALDQLGDAELVGGIDDRPEEADGDCLRPEGAGRRDRRQDATLVERDEDVPLGIDPLPELERQPARDIRGRILVLPKRVELPALAQQQHVGEALGREERGAGRLALDDRVRRPGRAVGEDLRTGEQLGDRHAERGCELRKALLDALERSLDVRRRLGQQQRAVLVGDDDIRERPPGVHGDAKPHQPAAFTRSELPIPMVMPPTTDGPGAIIGQDTLPIKSTCGTPGLAVEDNHAVGGYRDLASRSSHPFLLCPRKEIRLGRRPRGEPAIAATTRARRCQPDRRQRRPDDAGTDSVRGKEPAWRRASI